MIIFEQSYVAPSIMSADKEVYDVICNRFGGLIKPLGYVGTKVRSLTLKEALKQSWRGLKLSRCEDLLFTWGGDLAIFSFFISKCLFKKRTILGQNLILHQSLVNKRMTQKFRYWIYKWALNTKDFHMTVNSEPLIDYYSEWFKCSKDRFFLVYDAMTLNKEDKSFMEQRGSRNDFYVFGGGKEQRDIQGFFKIVELLPNIKFKAVFRRRDLPEVLPQYPNLELYHDTTREEFNQMLAGASVCCIPLKSISPCGLSVVQKAMLMEINIVSTETPSMRTIIPSDDYGYLLPIGQIEEMAKKIQFLHDNNLVLLSQRSNAIAQMEKFAPKHVASQLCRALDACCPK